MFNVCIGDKYTAPARSGFGDEKVTVIGIMDNSKKVPVEYSDGEKGLVNWVDLLMNEDHMTCLETDDLANNHLIRINHHSQFQKDCTTMTSLPVSTAALIFEIVSHYNTPGEAINILWDNLPKE